MKKFGKSKKKEMTLKDIAELIKVSANETTKLLEKKIISSAGETTKTLEAKVDSSVEWLATITQKQLLEIKGEFAKTHKSFDNLEKEIKTIRREFEDLKLRQDQVAYRFELKSIEKRIYRIETKIGLSAAIA